MNVFKLIYFQGCPNAEHARAVLLTSGVEFEVIKQDDLPENNEYKSYSSPTILKDNEIIFGQKLASGASACSMSHFNEKDLQRKILDFEKQKSSAAPKKATTQKK